MSHFYGSIPLSANNTILSAEGNKDTGLTVKASSPLGSILTVMIFNKETGKDYYEVWAEPNQGRGVSRKLASGVVGE